MSQYWQDVLTRSEATLAVWEAYFPSLTLGIMDAALFVDSIDGLPVFAQGRDDALQAYDMANQAFEFGWQEIRMLGIKVPAMIEGVIDEESGLLDDLDRVYAIRPYSADKALARGQALSPLWAAANAWQLGRTPPRAPVVRGTVTQAVFVTKLTACFTAKGARAQAQTEVDTSRDTLQSEARAMERICIRFLKAAEGMADPGSLAEAALANIPTTTVSDLPGTLGIHSLVQGGTNGLQLVLVYEPYAMEPDETAVVQWQVLDTDPGFDHAVPYDPSGNALGPFAVGQTIRLRTQVTNPHGSREGAVRQLTIVTPPS